MVFTEENVNDCVNDVIYADSLGVADIRIIPSAQYNKVLSKLVDLPDNILARHPILRYRVNNIRNSINVRGLNGNDSHRCYLVLDDMTSDQRGKHYPCIIYAREGGQAIGFINDRLRTDRLNWSLKHDIFADKICRENCIDVCRELNNKTSLLKNKGVN